MTVEKAAEILNVTRERIYQMLKKGMLDGEKPAGRDWYVYESSVYRESRKRRGKK